jgi:hypothetical protein
MLPLMLPILWTALAEHRGFGKFSALLRGGHGMAHGQSVSRMRTKMRSAMMFVVVFGMASLFCGQAIAQTPSPEDNAFQSYEEAHASICALYGCGNRGGTTAPRIGYDPCFLAQNAMRPCTSDEAKTAKPSGVDPNLAGTWEVPFKGGPWVLEIARNGTYKFHSEAKDGVPSNTGTFSASDGHWSMKAKTGYADAGDYLFQAPNVWIATGKLGAAAWLRPALAQNAMRPCTAKPQKPAKPAVIDANLIGTWQLPVKGGNWVWEISGDGSYKFHSEAMDGAPSHTGTFSAGDYHWSLAATTGIPGYTDSGNYLYQAPNVWMATGHLGGAAWLRPASATCIP